MVRTNGNSFSVYTSEEKTVLGVINELAQFTNELSQELAEENSQVIQELDGKTDLYGDHKGTWQGLSRPTLSDEGMRSTVEKLENDNSKSGLERFGATSKFITSMNSYIGLVNTGFDGDNGTRLYILPKAPVTEGIGGCIKIFGDNYPEHTDYRDLGIYFHANQQGDTGYYGNGVNWINVKVLDNGQYDNKYPDLGFSFQDGKRVAGRFTCLGGRDTVLALGSDKPKGHASGINSKLEVQGNMCLTDNGQIRFNNYDNTKSSVISLDSMDTLKESLIGNKETYINGSKIMSIHNNKVLFERSAYFNANLVIPSSSNGIVLTSPNGTKYKLKVSDDGVLSTERI